MFLNKLHILKLQAKIFIFYIFNYGFKLNVILLRNQMNIYKHFKILFLNKFFNNYNLIKKIHYSINFKILKYF